MNKLRPVFIVLMIFLLGIGAVGLVKTKRAVLKKTPLPAKAPFPVDTVLVRQGRLELREHYLGAIEPLQRATVSTRLTGYLLRVTKYEGDPVKEGELLAEIEARDLRARLARLKAELEAAKSELFTRKAIFDRDKKLLAHEAISQEAYDLSKNALQTAASRVEQLRQEIKAIQVDLSYARILAPFPGVVTKRFKDPGDLATPGAPILSLENPEGGYRLLIKVPQERAPRFVPGTKAYLLLGQKQLITHVYRVHPAVGPRALATVEIRLQSRPFGLPSGSKIGVELVSGAPEGFVLPLKALVHGKEPAVYTVREGRLVRVPVKVLGQSRDQIVVYGDLKPGEPVVVGDPGLLLRLYPGERVLVRGS